MFCCLCHQKQVTAMRSEWKEQRKVTVGSEQRHALREQLVEIHLTHTCCTKAESMSLSCPLSRPRRARLLTALSVTSKFGAASVSGVMKTQASKGVEAVDSHSVTQVDKLALSVSANTVAMNTSKMYNIINTRGLAPTPAVSFF